MSMDQWDRIERELVGSGRIDQARLAQEMLNARGYPDAEPWLARLGVLHAADPEAFMTDLTLALADQLDTQIAVDETIERLKDLEDDG